MFKSLQDKLATKHTFSWGAISLGLVFLLIEFFDEFHYSIQSTILPALRSDLAMIWLIGWVTGQAGLTMALWLLLIGPISLALFVPPFKPKPPQYQIATSMDI